MTQNVTDILNYIAAGVMWAGMVEDIDSMQKVRALKYGDIKSRLYLVLAWPLLLINFAISILIGPPPGGGPTPTA